MMDTIEQPVSVSVILPTYNRADLLDRAISSVLVQTYRNFELIVVDDASTDYTERVVKEFGDSRVRYIRQDINKGAGAARNRGIKVARGEFIAFQDSDDEWLPEKLQIQVGVLKNSPTEVGVFYSDMERVVGEEMTLWPTPVVMLEDGIVYGEALKRLLGIGIQTSLIRRECFSKVGMFDESLKRLQDFELFIRLSKYYYFFHINKALVRYYNTEVSISSDCEALFNASEYILQKYHSDMAVNRHALAKYLFFIGNYFCKKRYLKQGRIYLFRAVKIYPFNITYIISTLVTYFGEDAYLKLAKFKGKVEQALEGA